MEDKFYFVKQFYNVLDHNSCLTLIDQFENNPHDVQRNDYSAKFNFALKWNEINFKKTNIKYHDFIISVTTEVLLEYSNIIKSSGYNLDLSPWNFEDVRIKKYVGGSDDRIDMHYDVGNQDSSRRCLAFLYYLNDNFVGGNTVFHPNRVFKPKMGSVLVFPPYWMYPHKGEKVISGNKYIISTYFGIY